MDDLALYLRLVIAFIMLSTSLSKFKDQHTHVEIVRDYRIIPDPLTAFFAKSEMYVEFLLGIAFFLGAFSSYTAIGISLLLLVYMIAIAVNLIRGRTEVSCGCGGVVGNHKLSWWIVVRNLFLIVCTSFVGVTHANLGSLYMALTDWNSSLFNWDALIMLVATIFTLLLMYLFGNLIQAKDRIKTIWS